MAQLREIAALVESCSFLEHESGSSQLPVTPTSKVLTPLLTSEDTCIHVHTQMHTHN